jgi:hypothetical protein
MRDILMPRYTSQINSGGGGVVKVVLILSAGIDAGVDAGVDAAQNCGTDIRAAFA